MPGAAAELIDGEPRRSELVSFALEHTGVPLSIIMIWSDRPANLTD
jgi:hypothetical protein